MYGLRHNHIRIEDQQLNLKIHIMLGWIGKNKDIIPNTPKIFYDENIILQAPFALMKLRDKYINYLAKSVCPRL